MSNERGQSSHDPNRFTSRVFRFVKAAAPIASKILMVIYVIVHIIVLAHGTTTI